MVAENNLYKYSGALEKLNFKKEKNKNGSRTVELFFSFDIVNSSSYKDINYFGWPIVLTVLLRKLQNEVAKEIPEAQLWRVLGDEIIFFVTIKDNEEIYTSINSIFKILNGFYAVLKSGDFFEEFDEYFEYKEKILMKCSSNISLQAASWIAIVSDNQQLEIGKYDNVFVKYDLKDRQRIYEFLGQDIDTGFRIKKETQNRRLVVSMELACFLSERTEYLSRLHIITYKSLKGIWHNSLYPIIWYHDPKICGGTTFEDSFFYDETTYSQLSKEYFLNREREDGDLTSYMFDDVNRALNKILLDKNLEEKIAEIKSLIEITDKDERAVERSFDQNLLEMHCAIVCCDVINRKILIAKRTQRKIFDGFWEFGGAKANIELDLVDSIQQEYFEDFGIEIEVICNQGRNDVEPLPLALYQVNKVDAKQKGVICVAKVLGGTEIDMDYIIRRGKHDKIRWISEEEIEEFDEKAIGDFKITLKTIFAQWNNLFAGDNCYG